MFQEYYCKGINVNAKKEEDEYHIFNNRSDIFQNRRINQTLSIKYKN